MLLIVSNVNNIFEKIYYNMHNARVGSCITLPRV